MQTKACYQIRSQSERNHVKHINMNTNISQKFETKKKHYYSKGLKSSQISIWIQIFLITVFKQSWELYKKNKVCNQTRSHYELKYFSIHFWGKIENLIKTKPTILSSLNINSINVWDKAENSIKIKACNRVRTQCKLKYFSNFWDTTESSKPKSAIKANISIWTHIFLKFKTKLNI